MMQLLQEYCKGITGKPHCRSVSVPNLVWYYACKKCGVVGIKTRAKMNIQILILGLKWIFKF